MLKRFQMDFLSHLCGDEATDYSDNLALAFLSHLCGDEAHKPTLIL